MSEPDEIYKLMLARCARMAADAYGVPDDLTDVASTSLVALGDYELALRTEFERRRTDVVFYPFTVYALMCNGEVMYVGKTRRIERRISEHVRDGKEFTSYRTFACQSADEMDRLEAQMIALLSPPWNKKREPIT